MNSDAIKLLILLVLAWNPGNGKSFAQVRTGQDLQLQLSQVSVETSSVRFLVQLRNVGDHDLMLHLGAMMGNGNKQYLDDIHFSLKEPSGDTLWLDLIGPAIIGGRVDPLIVPLPVGAQYTFPMDLNNYCACKQSIWHLEPLHGHYVLQAQYQGSEVAQNGTNLDMRGIALFPIWTGHVSSQVLSFYAQKRQGKPKHQ